MILEPQQRVTWWGALGAVVLVCATAWAVFVNYDLIRTERRVQSELVALAYQVAAHAREALEGGQEAVETAADRASGQDLSDPAVRQRLHDDLVATIAGLPQVTALWLLDRSGYSVADTWPGSTATHDPGGTYADRAYFAFHASGARGIYIGAAEPGTVTGQLRFTVSTTVREPDGSFGGVAAAGIPSGYFAEAYGDLARVPGARIVLHRDDGALLAAWPPGTESVAANGSDRMVETASLPGFPVTAEVSWPTATVLAEWRERAWLTAASGLLAIAAFAAVTALGLRVAGSERRLRASLIESNLGLERLVAARTEEWAQSERRQRLVADALPALISFIDRDLVYRFNNRAYESWFGRSRDEITGRYMPGLVGDETFARARPHIEAALAGEQSQFESEFTFPGRGRVHVEALYLPQFDADGRVAGFYTFIHDIGERVEAERQREQLIDELNHRVKNTLASVQSFAMQSLKGDDPAMARARTDFIGRLTALARAHDLLTRSSWEGAAVEDVARLALQSFGSDDHALFTVRGENLRLPPRAALGLAMILHELATNASKYGALSVGGGHVDVSWTADERNLTLVWAEHGGPPVTPPASTGFGTRLIKGLARELHGEAAFEFRPEGLVCRVVTSHQPTRRAGA